MAQLSHHHPLCDAGIRIEMAGEGCRCHRLYHHGIVGDGHEDDEDYGNDNYKKAELLNRNLHNGDDRTGEFLIRRIAMCDTLIFWRDDFAGLEKGPWFEVCGISFGGFRCNLFLVFVSVSVCVYGTIVPKKESIQDHVSVDKQGRKESQKTRFQGISIEGCASFRF